MTKSLASFLNRGAVYELTPGRFWIGFGELKSSTVGPHNSQSRIYIPASFFDVTLGHNLSFEFERQLDLQELTQFLECEFKSESTGTLQKPDPKIFDNFFRRAFSKTPELKKIVLYETSDFQRQHSDFEILWKFLKNIGKGARSPGRWVGFWGIPDLPHWLGRSPEDLFRFNKITREIEIDALAGTMNLEECKGGELLSDEKLINEHSIVVQGILGDLIEAGCQILSVSKPLETDFHTLKHLLTKISAQAPKGLTSRKLLESLHPSAAIAGYPRGLALEVLKEFSLEAPRGIYGSPLVYEDPNQSIAAVLIRGLTKEDSWKLTTGVGLLPQSQIENERYELEIKRRAVLNQIGFQEATS